MKTENIPASMPDEKAVQLTRQQKHRVIYRDGRTEVRPEPVLSEYHLEICIGYEKDSFRGTDEWTSGRKNEAADGSRSHRIQTVCTPRYLKELVVGRLYTEGLISSADEIQRMDICRDKDGTVWKETGFRPANSRIAEVILYNTDDCRSVDRGFCRQSEEKVSRGLSPVKPIFWAAEWIFDLADRFKAGMPLHHQTSAAHSCFLSRRGELLFSCEDIGRHNALDKAVGFALMRDIDLTECIVYSSGRIPVDMAAKAIHAGIPVLVSKAVPTAEAVQLAKACRLTLIGGARSDRMKVYYDGNGGKV